MARPFLLLPVLSLALAVTACGRPLTRPEYPIATDEDDPLAGDRGDDDGDAPTPGAALATRAKPVSTGTISRQALNDVLDSGPGAFLRRVQIRAHVVDDRFGGWEITRFDLGADVDLAPGDVIVGVNGETCERPDQFGDLWEALRFARELHIDYLRGDDRRALHFAIVD